MPEISQQALSYSATERIKELSKPNGSKSSELNSSDRIPRHVLRYKATPRIIQLSQPKPTLNDPPLFPSSPENKKKRKSSNENNKEINKKQKLIKSNKSGSWQTKQDHPRIVRRHLPKEIYQTDNSSSNESIVSNERGQNNKKIQMNAELLSKFIDIR